MKNIIMGTCALTMEPVFKLIPSEKNKAYGNFLDTADGLSHIEAMYYEKLPEKEVRCKICPRKCKVGDLELGYCGLRKNEGGEYFFLTDNRICSFNVDPIEKKPLFHFLPGSAAYSIATAGCNMHCKFCQNYEISQVRPDQIKNMSLTPENCIIQTKNYGAKSIAYTYNEPVAYYDYMYRIAKAAKNAKTKNVMISAGFINPDPLKDVAQYLDAIKIDLKAFTESFYKKWCSAELAPILDALKVIKQTGVWLEIVNLAIPTLNDSKAEIEGMSKWILDNLGDSVPLHFSRFQPQYLLKNLPPTSISTLDMCRDTAMKAGLKFVYIGNVPGHEGENTYCPKCKKVVVKRTGYWVDVVNLKDGKCGACSESIPGIWS
ncbi:AmmeMemoRadiSam system radical SAM enzyme [bacterium]|nr:AmmeMemoRadiSam system radical SAM enzyme [bacterium]